MLAKPAKRFVVCLPYFIDQAIVNWVFGHTAAKGRSGINDESVVLNRHLLEVHPKRRYEPPRLFRRLCYVSPATMAEVFCFS
jgi:hypothetical protein